MVATKQADLDYYGRVACMPLALLINFSLFQYLLTMYYKRKREPHCMVLLFSGFFAFACLVPFAHEDDFVVNDLNDISETLSVTTFLVQITMIGRDINKKMRIRSLKYMTYVSEVLILLSIVVSVKDLIELPFPNSELAVLDPLNNALEEASLWFIFAFRFYFIAIAKGFKVMLQTKKIEIGMYLLFVTHEYPFQLLAQRTGLSWEEEQALWHRLTMAMCLLHTIREKLRSHSSRVTKAHSTVEPSRKSLVDPGVLSRAPTFVHLTRRVIMLGPSLSSVLPTKQEPPSN